MHNCVCLGAISVCDGEHDSDLTEEGILKMILCELESGKDHDLIFLEPPQGREDSSWCFVDFT